MCKKPPRHSPILLTSNGRIREGVFLVSPYGRRAEGHRVAQHRAQKPTFMAGHDEVAGDNVAPYHRAIGRSA